MTNHVEVLRDMKRQVDVMFGCADGDAKRDALNAAIAALLPSAAEEPVAWRFRHSAQENWHYGQHPQSWWECQPLYPRPASARPSAGAATVEGLREGNWHHPDGGRIVGWVIEPDDVERMKADAFCLPREVAEALENLRNASRPAPVPPATEGWAEDLARAVELAERLVAPGPKASHVSASECHEIADFIMSLATNAEHAAMLAAAQPGAK